MKADTYIDEVAISRALSGDRAVIANLTPPERAELLIRVRERRLAELAENAEWSAVIRPHTRDGKVGGTLPHSRGIPRWMQDVVDASGYKSGESLMKAARDAAKRHEKELV